MPILPPALAERRIALPTSRWLLLLILSIVVPAQAAPVIDATKTDSLAVDNNNDSQVDPGDTLEYTVVLQNTGDQTATNVNFSDTLDANTTLSGVAHVSPLAFADSYTSLGNVGITVNAANGVLANDVDPDSTVSLSVIAAAGATAQGGAFAIAADGSFSYTPPLGFEGIDTFSYTLSDGDPVTPNDTEAVTIIVNEVIWFIDNSVTGPGTGQLSDPFNSIANFNNLAADKEGDIIFIYETGSGVYVADTQLLNNQTVIGQGASSSIAAITGIAVPPFSNTLPSTGGSRPTLGNSLIGVRIQANNTLVGFDIGNTNSGGGGIVIFPQFVNIGTITIDDMAIGGTGRAILFLGSGTLDITLDSVTSSGDSNGLVFFPSGGLFDGSFTVLGATNITNNQNVGINISNTSATYDFGDTTIALNTPGTIPVANAININNSPSGSFTFDSLAVTANRGAALFANNGGTVTVTGSSNTASATLNPAVSLTNTTIGAGGITFQSVSSTNAANGIVLNNSSGGIFSVTGIGSTAGSGGTLQNISGSGVSLIDAQNVSLARMNLINTAQTPAVATGSATCDDEDSGTNTDCNAAVHMHNASFIALFGLVINGSNQHGLNGNNVSDLTVESTTLTNIGDGSLENGLAFINLLGTVLFNNLDVTGSATRNVLIENNTGTAQINVNNGSSFNNTTAGALGEDGFHFVASGNANVTLTIEESDFIENDAVQLKVHAEEDSIVTVTIDDNDIDGNPSVVGNSGIDLTVRDNAQLNYTVTNNTLQPIRIHGINLVALGGGTAIGRINSNTIDETNQGSAIRVVAEVTTSSNPFIITEINNNNISNSGGGGLLGAVHIEARTGANTGTANIQATVDNNSVALNSGSSDNAGAHYEIYNSDGHTVCANFTNNAASGSASFGTEFYIGNPVSGSGLGAGIVRLQMFSANVQTTWTNNGNAGTTFNEGTNPGGGTCTTVAAIPSTSKFAQADKAVPAVESPVTLTTLVEPLANSRQPMAESDQRSVVSAQPTARNTMLNTRFLDEQAIRVAALDGKGLLNSASDAPLTNFIAKAGETIPVSIGAMEAGQSVTIIFRATINDPQTPVSNNQVCNQGTVTADGGINVVTDDPAVGGATDTTCTAVDAPSTGAILLQKEVPDGEGDPNNPNQTFTLNLTNFADINAGSSNFTNGSGFLGLNDLLPDTYTVRELDLAANWTLDDISCTSGNGTSTIGTFTPGDTSLEVELAAGDEVRCTFSNSYTPPGSLTIVKEAEPEDGTDFAFTSDIPGGGSFSLDDEPSQSDVINQSITFADLPVGTYAITETLPSDWALDSTNCTGASGSTSLNGETLTVPVGAGEAITCTFSNSKQASNIILKDEFE